MEEQPRHRSSSATPALRLVHKPKLASTCIYLYTSGTKPLNFSAQEHTDASHTCQRFSRGRAFAYDFAESNAAAETRLDSRGLATLVLANGRRRPGRSGTGRFAPF